MYVHLISFSFSFFFFNFLDWRDGCYSSCSTASFGIFRFTKANWRWLKLQLRQEFVWSVILLFPRFWSEFRVLLYGSVLLCPVCVHPIWKISPYDRSTVAGHLGKGGPSRSVPDAFCKLPCNNSEINQNSRIHKWRRKSTDRLSFPSHG